MKHFFSALLVAVGGLSYSARVGQAQQAIPIVALPLSVAVSHQTLGTVLGVRETRSGAVLVNDAGSRQLRLFETSLASSTVVLDSADGLPNSYGRRPAPLIPYLGDSTLIPDFGSVALLVLDGAGKVVRTMSLPNAADFNLIRSGASADNQGRLIFVGDAPRIKTAVLNESALGDSLPLLRADFATRQTDTVARIARPLTQTKAAPPGGGATIVMWSANPLRPVDVWSVMPNGDVAIVRGHDYHVDWIRADNSQASTAKMAFDWRRLTDNDKKRILDSTRAEMRAAMDDGTIQSRIVTLEILRNPAVAALPRSDARVPVDSTKKRSAFGAFALLADFAFTADSVPDYYPPVRANASMADGDGNVWILPTTSTASLHGELVYDVVNVRGDVFKRVRLPVGRLLAGFGKNGAVYMTHGSIASGFYLERSELPTAPTRYGEAITRDRGGWRVCCRASVRSCAKPSVRRATFCSAEVSRAQMQNGHS